MTLDWQGKIVQALITIILTALGTLSFQCAKYVFFDYPREIAQVRQNYQYEQQRAIASQKNALEFLQALSAALGRSVQRMEKFLAIEHQMPLGPKKLREVHFEAAKYASEANKDYGALQSYAVEDKLLSQSLRDSSARGAAADAEAWEVLFRCSRPGMAQREINACSDDLPAAEFALRRAGVGMSQMTLNESMMQIDMDRESQQFKLIVDQMFRWYTASIIGITASLLAYFFILIRIVAPTAQPSKLEAQAQREDAIAGKKQAGDESSAREGPISDEGS